ncbi:MAG: hypothetical protein JST04_09505 [Bdellovibrionales bacterium]|nr:hypothetical protein [Bdellovibrionales bacterium]
MRGLYALIVFSAIFVAGLVRQGELDSRGTADRTPASEAPRNAKESALEREPAAAANATVNVPGDERWPSTGERWIYRFERKASAEFAGKPWLRLSVGGRVAVEPTESAGSTTNGDSRYYLLSFQVDRLEMQGQSRYETIAFPGVRIELDGADHPRELRFVASREGKTAVVSDEEADFVRDLAAQWLFFEKRTRIGEGEVEWSSASGGKLVTKRILRYPARPEITKLDSNHEWALGGDASGKHVERIEGVENFRLAANGGDFVQATSYRWVWTATERLENKPKLALGNAFAVDGVSATAGEGLRAKPDPARVARDWPKLKDLAPHARLKLFRDAKRALDAGANELVSLILKDLRGRASTSVEWRTGVGALASTSNPQAAAALLALYREPGRTTDEKLSILSGVAAGEGAPAPEWKPAFEAALDSAPANPATSPAETAEARANGFDPQNDPEAALREASLYALGSSIRKETDADRRTALEGVLWNEVKEARTEKAQTAVLEAIGNSGSGEYLSYVKESLATGTPRVRAKAVGAVRFLASDLAQPVIEKAKADPAPVVRKAAEWSAKFQAAAAPDPDE